MRQWLELKAAFERLGHTVTVIEGGAGLPDMVFAANGGLVIDGIAMGARFRHAERAGEEALFDAAFSGLGLALSRPHAVNEGEGDFLVGPHEIFAGTGFRTDPAAHAEAALVFGREVVTLELVDPRFYHLDTCFAVLDEHTAAVYPGAFSAASMDLIRGRFEEVVEATETDAAVLGLNIVSDGRHVLFEAAATGLAAQLADRGFVPIGIDMSEFRKAGGAVKCATLELRTLRRRHPRTDVA
jgi:N-dimethylarginine dimethylaminohydrolase